MKRKIVIKLPMHNEKQKSKALQIVVAEGGVMSVSIGKENDQLEVIGEGVDSVCLAKSLRKKFCFAEIVSVAEVKPPPPPPPPPTCVVGCPPLPCIYPPPPCMYLPPPCSQMPFNECYDTGPPNCSIM